MIVSRSPAEALTSSSTVKQYFVCHAPTHKWHHTQSCQRGRTLASKHGCKQCRFQNVQKDWMKEIDLMC